MTEPSSQSTESPRSAATISPSLAALLALVALWAALLVPLRILAKGWLPPDDAKRHVAYVLSEKSWCETVLLRDPCEVEAHPGWHATLRLVRRMGVESSIGLLKASVVLGFGAVLIPPLFLARWREAWLATLCLLAVFEPGEYWRIALGRPFVITIGVLVALGWLWRPLGERVAPWRRLALLVALIALATWVHGNPYLWALPAACLLLAAGPRVGFRFAAVVASGIALGALATGSPVAFLDKTLHQPIRALLQGVPARLLVPEFQPSTGSALVVALVGTYLLLGRRPAGSAPELHRQPFFVLAVAGWGLGFLVGRFWSDWGLPALCVWSAQEIERAIGTRPALLAGRNRLRWTVALSVLLVLATTHDRDRRWSRYVGHTYLNARDETTAHWLPGPGGILYNDSMNTYFDTFYANPRGEWRYVLGFEPGVMPLEDELVYRRIQRNPSTETYRPWVERLRPQDRLVLLLAGPEQLDFPELEWKRFETGHWIGRLRAERRATRSGP